MVPLVIVAAMTGVLASKHLRTLAVIAVITQAMREKPCFVAVVVLVVEVYLQLLKSQPSEFGPVVPMSLRLGYLARRAALNFFRRSVNTGP